MRFTTDNPTNNLQNALNLFFIKGHQAYVRGGGPEPDYKDVSLYDFIRRIVKTHDLNIPTADEAELSEAAFERLFDGTDTMEGVVALLYTAGWAFAEIRWRLKMYENTGLTPEQVAAMKQELINERYRHDRLQDFEVAEAQELAKVKAERDELLETIHFHGGCDFCSHEALHAVEEPCCHCRGTGGENDNWEWRGAEDTNVPSKED